MRRGYWTGWHTTAVIAALLTGAETLLLYLLSAELAGGTDRTPLSWPALWTLGLAAFFLPRSLSGARTVLYLGALGAVLVASTALAVHSAAYPHHPLLSSGWVRDAARALEFRATDAQRSVPLTVALAAAVWWRQTARETPGSDAAGAVFRAAPIPVLLLALIAAVRWGGSSPETALAVEYLAAFFLLSLTALALARWVENPAAGASARSLLAWMTASVVPIVAAVAGAAVLSALLFRTAGRTAASILEAALLGIGWVLVAVSTALATVVWAVMYLIVTVVRWLGIAHPAAPRRQATEETLRRLAELPRNNPRDPTALFWVLLTLLLLVLIYVFARYRPRRETLAGRGLVRESVWERPSLTGLTRSLQQRLTRLVASRRDPLRQLLADPLWRYTAQVRMAYREALRRYTDGGAARHAGETPREHARRVGSESLLQLTLLYEQARYSGTPCTEDAASEAHTLLAAIRLELETTKSRPARAGSAAELYR